MRIGTRYSERESGSLQVAVAMSIISAVWCAKTVDNNAVPFYKNDLRNFYISRDLGGSSLSSLSESLSSLSDTNAISNTSPRFIIVVVHGVLLGSFCLLFILCSFTGQFCLIQP